MTDQEIFEKHITIYPKENGKWTAVAMFPKSISDRVRKVMADRNIHMTLRLSEVEQPDEEIWFSKGTLYP